MVGWMDSFVGSFVVPSVGRLVGWLVGRSVVQSVFRSFVRFLCAFPPDFTVRFTLFSENKLRLSFGYFVVFVVRLFSFFSFYFVSVTNWLLSHAVRTLHSCPEEFFDLLPVVSNLAIFHSKLITQVTANFVFFLQIILFDSQEDDPELQHYCHRVSTIQIDSIRAILIRSLAR